MSKPFTPRPYQRIAADHIINTPRSGLFLPMGMGKSASTIMALEELSLVEDIYPVLICAPLRVAKSVWPEELSKWDQFKHLTISPIIGTAQERKDALKVKAHFYSINYENLNWLVNQLGDKWPFRVIVADENTKLKSFRITQGGKRAHALASRAHTHTRRFIGLSGTPASNGLQSLWGSCWFFDQGQRLGKSYSAFQQRWFRTGFDGYSTEPLPHAQKEIQDKLKDICLSLDPKDYFDLKEPILNKLYVDLPSSARKLYKNMEKEFFMQIEEHDVEAFNAASKSMKLLQIANGAAYVGEDAEQWKEIHDVKLQALEDIIEEASGAPVLVAYHFRSDLDRLRKYFPKGRVLDKQASTIRDWNSGKISLMFAHPASAGHGLNLADGGNIIAFFSLDWNLENHLQIIERLGPIRQFQAGYNRNVFIHYIIAKNTIDELVLERLTSKRKVQDILMDALKARKQ